jgi:thimet oligopeptidase
MTHKDVLRRLCLLLGSWALIVSVYASDLTPMVWTMTDVREVERHCTQRLGVVAQLRKAAESLPIDSDPLVLLRAYDRVYGTVRDAASEIWALSELAQQASIRSAAAKCFEEIEVERVRLQHSKPLFDRLLAAQKAGVPQEFRYILNRQLDSFRRNGVNLDSATRARLETLSKRIAAASFEFQDNIDNDTPTIEVASSDLAGLPGEARSRLPAAKNGRVRISVDQVAVWPILDHSDNELLRKLILKAALNIGWPANDAVFKRLAADRAELAKLLGFDTYAHYQLADYMARTPENARAFIDQMATHLRAPSDEAIARLLARARLDTPSIEKLPEWSTWRAVTQLQQENLNLDPEELRRYFSYQNTRDGLLDLTQELFGVRIRPWITNVWAPDVDAFEMLEGDRVIGRFYIDPFPRDGKHKSPRIARIRTGAKAGPIPEAVLILNTERGRIDYSDVVTFFHEFGHLLHVLFSGQSELAMQVSRDMEYDAIEAPSQVLEAWARDYETLRRFARNETGQPIPQSLVERLNAGRSLYAPFGDMYYLADAAVALDYHSRDLTNVDLTAAYFNTLRRYLDLDRIRDSHPQAAFMHLAATGCAYYNYIWSKALAVDLLTRFQKEGLHNPATAAAYREMILAPGGSESMNVLARRFLGRDWSVDAYVAQIKSTTASSRTADTQ